MTILRRMGIFGCFGALCAGVLGCASNVVLTGAEAQKLDMQLQRLITGETIPEGLYNITVDEQGRKRYGVIILSDNTDDLKKSGISVNSVQGEIATARLTIEEIRRAANIPSVKSIKNTTRNYPQ